VMTGSERQIQLPTSTVRGIGRIDDTSLILSAAIKGGDPAQLFQLSYPTGRLSRLTNDLDDYGGISLTDDHTSLAAARSEASAGIWVGDGTGRNVVVIIPWTAFWVARTEGYVTWAGQRLLYPKSVAGRLAIWGVTPEGMMEEVVSSGVNPSATS